MRLKQPTAVLFIHPKNKATELVFPEERAKSAPKNKAFLKKKTNDGNALHSSTYNTHITKDDEPEVMGSKSLTMNRHNEMVPETFLQNKNSPNSKTRETRELYAKLEHFCNIGIHFRPPECTVMNRSPADAAILW